MKEFTTKFHQSNLVKGLACRALPTIAAVIIGLLVMLPLPSGNLFADEAKIELEDPSYESFYAGRKGYFFRDPKWIEETLPRLQWPKEGERVPEMKSVVMTNHEHWINIMRKLTKDWEKLGLKVNLKGVSFRRYLQAGGQHYHGDVEVHNSAWRPERIDPAEYLTSRGYGRDRRNFGEWVNKEYDEMIRLQSRESNPKKRREYVFEAQKIMADDLYISQFGWGPAIIEAYNSAEWDGVVQTKSFGIGHADMFWTYMNIKPKTSRKRLMVGTISLVKTTNILGARRHFRGIGRMIYDRLAFLDKDLNVIPWAVESWDKVDNRTWDVKLRGGMKFHDGKPVTVDDLKFTFDFTMKYERAILWTANRWLESVEIVDRQNRIVRFRFKNPYGQFEAYFLMLNYILPKHLFEGIMERQGIGDDVNKLKIPRPIGSGPFKFSHYKKDAEMLLVANKEHFNAPKIDDLLYVVVPSIDGILGRLETQEIDIGEQLKLTPSQADRLKKIKHLSVVRTPDIMWYHGVPRASWLPWRDIEFRRAWHHSIDRKFIVDVLWEGEGRIPTSNTFLVDGNPWHNPNLPPIPEYDLNLARKILKDAGYSWGRDGRLVYPPPTDKKFIERVTRVTKEGYHWGGLKMQPRK